MKGKKRADRLNSALLWLYAAEVNIAQSIKQIEFDDPCVARMAARDAIGKLNGASRALLSCYRKPRKATP